MIVLDTHMWIWFNTADPRLPAQVVDRTPECVLSVVSVWELMILVQKGRVQTSHEPALTPDRWLERYPFKLLELDYRSVLLSRTLPFSHDDPADRFIAATAFSHGAALATNDARLRALPWLTTL